jgi:hypothetical protein
MFRVSRKGCGDMMKDTAWVVENFVIFGGLEVSVGIVDVNKE